MKKIIAPGIIGSAILGASIVVASGTNQDHDNSDGHHKSMSGHHESMRHGTENGHHDPKMKAHHKSMSQASGYDMDHDVSLAGKPGKENEVSRSILVEAGDNMRFTHAPFDIKDGETIKFIVNNKSAITHEFSIGTKDEHVSHGKMMMANPNMHHGPGGASITIKPGETETLIWSFKQTWEVEVACNIPGHYQAGMYSPVNIKGK